MSKLSKLPSKIQCNLQSNSNSNCLIKVYYNIFVSNAYKILCENFCHGNPWLNDYNFPAKRLRKNTGAQNTHAPIF